MANQRTYPAPGLDLGQLGEAMSQWYRGQGLESQVIPGARGVVVVQARKGGTLAAVGGTTAALNVTLTPQGDNVLVDIGGAKWTDKALSGVGWLILFWPMALLPAYGAYKQKEIIDESFDVVQRYISTGGLIGMGAPVAGDVSVTAPAASSVSQAACPACGQPLREGAKFCDSCGAKIVTNCPECGGKLRPGPGSAIPVAPRSRHRLPRASIRGVW